jgi:FkbM family methyltransferase
VKAASKARHLLSDLRRRTRNAALRRRIPKLAKDDGVADVRGVPLVLPDATTSRIAKKIIAHGYTEPEFTDVVERVLGHDQVVADIGASIGYFTCLMSRAVGPGGSVLAFEPWPKALRYLEHNVQINGFNQVQIIPAAAFDEAGPAHLGPPRYRLTMGTERPADAIEVRVERFDDFPEVRTVSRLDAIKIDIEGAELRALRGMTSTIERWQPLLLMEVHPSFLQLYGDSLDRLYGFLDEVGYAYHAVEGRNSGEDGFHIAAAPIDRLNRLGLPAFGGRAA